MSCYPQRGSQEREFKLVNSNTHSFGESKIPLKIYVVVINRFPNFQAQIKIGYEWV